MGAKPKIIEEPLIDGTELEELDIYEEEGVENLMDDEEISDTECGFMAGFLAS